MYLLFEGQDFTGTTTLTSEISRLIGAKVQKGNLIENPVIEDLMEASRRGDPMINDPVLLAPHTFRAVEYEVLNTIGFQFEEPAIVQDCWFPFRSAAYANLRGLYPADEYKRILAQTGPGFTGMVFLTASSTIKQARLADRLLKGGRVTEQDLETHDPVLSQRKDDVLREFILASGLYQFLNSKGAFLHIDTSTTSIDECVHIISRLIQQQ